MPASAGIALLTLLRAAVASDDSTLLPLAAAVAPYSPTDELTRDLLLALHAEGLIWIDPDSDLGGFVFEGEQVVAFHVDLVGWTVPDPGALELVRFIETLAIGGEIPAAWRLEAVRLHRRLAAAEVRAYLIKCLGERGLPSPSGTSSTDLLIRNLLTDYSVAQAFRIVWGGAQQTADFILRRRVNRVHASNYAVGACQRFADYARVSNWQVKAYRRPYDLPRSILSCVLHDVLLMVGPQGFERPARELWPDLEPVATAADL